MFNKDTFRLIRKTSNRFLSLFMIVMVASAFMMGLFSNATILRESVDIYDDELALQDIQLYSSYGFCDEDVEALRNNPDVKEVFASRFVDAYGGSEEGYISVFRIEELERNVDQFELVSGRMPRNYREALILGEGLESSDRLIGKKFRFFLNDEEIKDHLMFDTFTIVGTCKSPAYISKIQGPSNCENQDLDAVLYVPNQNFIFDYYTTIYLTLEGADERISYTSAYEDFVEEKTVSIESTRKDQESFLRDRIYDENMVKLNDAKKEFYEKKAEGEKELNDAKQKLDDANIEIIVGQSLIDSNKATLEISRQELESGEKLLESSEAQLNDGIRQAEAAAGRDFDTLYTEVSAAYTSYIMIRESNFDTVSYTDRIVGELQEEKQQNLSRMAQIDAEMAALDPGAEDYADRRADLELEKQNLTIRNAVIDETLSNYDGIDETAGGTKQEMLDAIDAQFNGSIEETYIQLRTLYEGREKLKSSRRQLEEGREQLEEGEAALIEAQQKLDAGRREYERGLKEYNEGLMTFNDEIEKAQNDLNKAEEELNDLPNATWMILNRDSQYSAYMYKNTIRQMTSIGYALPFLFYLVAALVCMTTMTRLVDEQRSQIGIFMALGFSEGQVIGKYVLYALLAALSGSMIGIIGGQLVFPTVIYNTWRLMYDLPKIKLYFPVVYVVICIMAFSVLMSLVTFLVVRKTIQDMPSQLLRPKAPKSSKRVLLERIGFLWRRLSFTSKITARNIFRYKSRFLMTVIGVAGCTALLVVGFGIKDSISDIVSIQYGQIFAYDYQIDLENDHHLSENISVLKKDLNNNEVVPFMTYTTKAYMNNDDGTLTVEVFDARESRQVLNLRQRDHRTDIELDNSGVVISEKFCINHKLKEGDLITIESQNGLKREVKIAKICEFYFQHYLFISEEYYEEVFGENVHANSIAVSTDDVESLKKDVDDLEDYISMVDFSGLIAQFETMIKALNFIIAVIIVAAGSLALVVLINLIQVNIAERIREIATLKVLGFHDQEVNSYIFKEVLLLTVIGGLAGLPLGVAEHHFIMNVINMDMMMFGMNISLFSFSVSFVITLVFTLLVSMFMRRHLRDIAMVESLKSVE